MNAVLEARVVSTPDETPFEAHRCVKCGCTEGRACAGGCGWLVAPGELEPGRADVGLCTACVKPSSVPHVLRGEWITRLSRRGEYSVAVTGTGAVHMFDDRALRLLAITSRGALAPVERAR